MASKHATPTPAQIRDQDLADVFSDANPYAEHGPYDMDYEFTEAHRPAPIPYDDPYADECAVDILQALSSEPTTTLGEDLGRHEERGHVGWRDHQLRRGPARGRGRGNSSQHWGRGRTRGDRGTVRSGRHRHINPRFSRDSPPKEHQFETYEPHIQRPLSPTSIAIARVTGEYGGAPAPGQTVSQVSPAWSDPYYNPSAYHQPYVQPHINPRFASAFGINIGFPQQQEPVQSSYAPGCSGPQRSPSQESWFDHGPVSYL